MIPKNLLILGSTGSIGKSTLDVVDAHPDKFRIRGLAAFSNVALLAEQCKKYKPEAVCLVDESKADDLKAALKGEEVQLLFGEQEIVKFAAFPFVDIVVNAIVGAAGLLASYETVRIGRTLAVANKESLVCGGPIFPELARQTGAKILPIDSEHSAIWQSAMSGKESEIRNIILTASGGPFRTTPK
ncbi:MAG: 1-deoxy-D-xylulose-5-phosphate reductoisomerase, partial [Calditrichaeota bacterium]